MQVLCETLCQVVNVAAAWKPRFSTLPQTDPAERSADLQSAYIDTQPESPLPPTTQDIRNNLLFSTQTRLKTGAPEGLPPRLPWQRLSGYAQDQLPRNDAGLLYRAIFL